MNVYVPFKDISKQGPYQVRRTFTEIVLWLQDNIGEQDKDWKWLRGDLHAQGVYLPTTKDAIIFKLRFNV